MMRFARYIGTLAALGFVAFLVWRSASEFPLLDFASRWVWLGLAGGLTLYIASQGIGAAAWRATLGVYDIQLPRGRAESQLLVSQIGKYIPGNIAHLIGRAVLAREDGVTTASIGGALLLEVGFLLGTAVFVICGMLLAAPGLLALLTAELPEGWVNRSIIAGGVILAIGLTTGQMFLWRRAGRPKIVIARFVEPILLHLANFAVLGVSLWFITLVVAPQSPIGVGHCIAIFSTAWVAGFLMPGAPGGVGVRDGIIAIGLELFVAPGAALGAALLHRGLSILGDLATFCIGLLLRCPQNQVQSDF
ncbi:lysylphosphatidylglycerol synthase domain-containing protein [Rhodobacteraceae bacterium]|nr:lysylphosphatidylglycerol synthase domain-containing protein [Paracoccaceae bacterium]